MKKYFLLLGLMFSFSAFSQDKTVKELKAQSEKTIAKDAADTTQKIWKKGGSVGLNYNQGSLSNWSAGGDKFSMSLNALTNLYAFYKKDKHSWDNSLDLAYGIVKTTSLGKRKASDRIDFLTKYGYELKPKLNLAGLGNFRTQFSKGYNYLKDVNNADSAVLFSRNMAPAYALLSLGLDWKPTTDFSLFFSPATARWVISTDKMLAPNYGIALGKTSLNEFGAFATANYIKTFNKTINFKSRLDLFSNYKSEPQNIDIFWSNAITAKLTKYINFSFNLDMIYDDNTLNVNPNKGPAPQILQLMGIGFAYSFKN